MGILWIVLLTIVLTLSLTWAICRAAGMQLKLNLLPTLMPGEKVLFVKKWVVFCTALSHPSYRGSFSLPPVLDQGFLVTNRRVIHIFYIFRILAQEFEQQFEGKEAVKDAEFIKEVRTGNHRLCGSYLEIVSENSTKLWLRSRRCRIRLSMKNPERVCEIISEAMIKAAGQIDNRT